MCAQVIAILQSRVARAHQHREAGPPGPFPRGGRPQLRDDGRLRGSELLLRLRRTRIRQRAVGGHRERPAIAVARLTDEHHAGGEGHGRGSHHVEWKSTGGADHPDDQPHDECDRTQERHDADALRAAQPAGVARQAFRVPRLLSGDHALNLRHQAARKAIRVGEESDAGPPVAQRRVIGRHCGQPVAHRGVGRIGIDRVTERLPVGARC